MNHRILNLLGAGVLLGPALFGACAASASALSASAASLTLTIADIRNTGGGGLADLDLLWTDFGDFTDLVFNGNGTAAASNTAPPNGVLGVGDAIVIGLASNATATGGAGLGDAINERKGELLIDNLSFTDIFEVDLRLSYAGSVSASSAAPPRESARALASIFAASALTGVVLDRVLIASTEDGRFDPAAADSVLVTLTVSPTDFSDSVYLEVITENTAFAQAPIPGTLALLSLGVLGGINRRFLARPRLRGPIAARPRQS